MIGVRPAPDMLVQKAIEEVVNELEPLLVKVHETHRAQAQLETARVRNAVRGDERLLSLGQGRG